MSGRLRALLVTAGLAIVAAVVVFALRPPKHDGFNDCVAGVVAANQSLDRSLDVEVSNKIIALFTGGTGGDGPALKIGTQQADKAAYQTISDARAKDLLDACGRQYGKSRGPTNVELQIWTRIQGQAVSNVDVVRMRRAGDTCRTVNGTCLLTLHDVESSGSEALEAKYSGISTPKDLPRNAIAAGTVVIDVEPASMRQILVKNGAALVTGAAVTVEDPRAGTAIRNASCVGSGTFGRNQQIDCARAETGTDGHGAAFLIPASVTELAVRIERGGEGRDSTARSEGSDFTAPWGERGGGDPPPARCGLDAIGALKAALSGAPDRLNQKMAKVHLRFEIGADRVVRRVTPTAAGDLADLARSTLEHKQLSGSVKPIACVGELDWMSK